MVSHLLCFVIPDPVHCVDGEKLKYIYIIYSSRYSKVIFQMHLIELQSYYLSRYCDSDHNGIKHICQMKIDFFILYLMYYWT